MKARKLFIDCKHDFLKDHMTIFEIDDWEDTTGFDPPEFNVHNAVDYRYGFFRRVWAGLKYIFCPGKYWDTSFTCTSVSEDDVARIRDFCDSYLEEMLDYRHNTHRDT